MPESKQVPRSYEDIIRKYRMASSENDDPPAIPSTSPPPKEEIRETNAVARVSANPWHAEGGLWRAGS